MHWVRAATTPQRVVVRSRIVLLAHEGLTVRAIASRLGVSPATARLWCRRFQSHGVATLERDAPGRGRRPGMTHNKVEAVFRALRLVAANGLPWSTRRVAAQCGVSAVTVWRVARRYQVTPASTVDEIDASSLKALSETRHGSG